MGLLIIPTVVLLKTTDASKMYHGVRGQDTIKLYVIFNALEVSSVIVNRATGNNVDLHILLFTQIADKLCSAFGQDILDTLFAAETLGARSSNNSIRLTGQRETREERARRRRERARPFFFFLLALAYVRKWKQGAFRDVTCSLTILQMFMHWCTFISLSRSMWPSTRMTTLS